MFRQKKPLCIFWALLCALVSPAASFAEAPQTKTASPCISTDWPHTASDLPVDESILFGRLENGLRYLVKKNGEPRNRVALYLNVQAGSLEETNGQRGFAHFLEHMLFNGSTHYPPGTLVKYFQSMGMDFGADSNAHTSYGETVYKLILPATDEKTLAKGLLILADFARGALLSEAEVARERGVIFSEKRDRNSAQSRVRQARLAFDLAGTLVAQRDPIGTDECLNQAGAEQLRAYYEAWYRPDNMVVVVVGDVETALAEKLIKRQLTGLKAAEASNPLCPNLGRPAATGVRMRHLAEPELGSTEISLAHVTGLEARPDSKAQERAMLHRFLAAMLLTNRLHKLEQENDSPLAQSEAFSTSILPQLRYNVLCTHCQAGNWEAALRLLVLTLEQARRHGFTAAELARGKTEILAMLEKEVQTMAARDSRDLAASLIQDLNSGEVSMSPTQALALFQPMLAEAGLAEVREALLAMWPEEPRSLSVAGTASGKVEARMHEIYAATLAADIPPFKNEAARAFPYLPMPATAHAPAREQFDPETGIHTLHFKNGLVAHLKKTSFKPGEVLLSAHFGSGRQSEPAAGAALLAQGFIQESGTAAMESEQLEEALTGANFMLSFHVGPESFSWQGETLPAELERLFQLLYTRLHDPAFRPEALKREKERLGRMYARLANSVEGVQLLAGERFLSGGSRFYSLPSQQETEAVTLTQLENWLRPAFSEAALEINLAGDFDIHEAKRLLGRYFGQETRLAEKKRQEKTAVFPTGQSLKQYAPDSSGKAHLVLAWKTGDCWNIQRNRGLNMLARVLEDRVRVAIREQLGAAYSPTVFHEPSRIDVDFGLFKSILVIAPEQADTVERATLEVVSSLVEEGLSAEEFKRAQAPLLTGIREQMCKNGYWLRTVLDLSSRHPEQLEWPKTIFQKFSTMKREDLNRLAKKYLRPEQAAKVLILPGKAGPKKEAAPN